MTKVKQTKAELLSHLNENLGFLKASASSFDQGHHGEAKRLAVSIRVLVHDTQQSKSLLGLLGWKDGFGFFDTAHDYDPKNLLSHHGLVGLHMTGDKSSYWAPLGNGPDARSSRYVRFPDWWNKVVISDKGKNKFTRRDLVLGLANKDGGAHVDPDLDQAYADLTRNNSIGWVVINGTDQSPLMSVELFSVRQIAYEVICSIERKIAKTNASLSAINP